MTIIDLKERLLKGEITSISWLPTERMSADILTKERKIPEALEDVLLKNDLDLGDTSTNEVKAHGQEVGMSNIRNKSPGVSLNWDQTV